MREDLLSGKTLVRIENNYPDVKARDVPWRCVMLLPPVCMVIVSVTGARLALKHIFGLFGFFRLWTVENVMIIGCQLPRVAQGSIRLRAGVHPVVCAFSRKTWGEKMPLKENYCIAY